MLTETISSPVTTADDIPAVTQEQLYQMLKTSPLSHPALNRVQAKIVATAETESVISSYDRMHHRHSRS
jgi:hypothetical protein